MTLAILTLILLGYMKVTGKTLPAVEKRLNKVKNSKKSRTVMNVSEQEVKNINFDKVGEVAFKKNVSKSIPYSYNQVMNKTYSGVLKI